MPLPALLCLAAVASAASFFTRAGDYRLAGLFSLHLPPPRSAARPFVDGCDK